MVRKAIKVLTLTWATVGVLALLFLAFEAGLTWLFRSRLQEQSLRHAYSLALDTDDSALVDRFTAEMSRQINSPTSLRWQPYVYWRAGAFAGEYIEIDERGIRRTFSEVAGEGGSRVFAFGGSTMFGAGARDQHTIASELAGRLAGDGRNVEVVNYGQSGYVSAQECLTLALECRAGNVPDVVVFYDGVNDVASALRNLEGGMVLDEFSRSQKFDALRERSPWPYVWLYWQSTTTQRWLTGETSMFPVPKEMRAARGARYEQRLNSPRVQQRIGEIIQGMTDRSAEALQRVAGVVVTEDLFDEMIEAYLRNVQWAKRLGSEHGFECVFFWQPNLYTKAALSVAEQEFAPHFDGNRESFNAAYARFELRRRQALAGEDEWNDLRQVNNLAAMFDGGEWGDKTAFIDAAHTTEIANQAIAGAMLRDVQRALARRERATDTNDGSSE